MNVHAVVLAGLGLLLTLGALVGCGASRTGSGFSREEPFTSRVLHPFSGERWIGTAVAYGPHRDGQYPGGPSPDKEELRQDLQLMSRHWGLLRMYGAVGPAETVLQIIHEEGLDMKVMLGVWIAVEERREEDGAIVERFPDAASANRREVESAIRLAADYPKIVIAVSVGNETQVFWSSHRTSPELLVDYVREVRERTTVPVTVADDFNFWNKPESGVVARELDFIAVNAHPLWNGMKIEDALDWIQDTLAEVQAVHPHHLLVLGETGWATRKHTEGEQATLIKGQPGEREQKVFYDLLTSWSLRERIPVFFFEAFDENWKGGEHPDEVEKHWGLFGADRIPKQALAGGS